MTMAHSLRVEADGGLLKPVWLRDIGIVVSVGDGTAGRRCAPTRLPAVA